MGDNSPDTYIQTDSNIMMKLGRQLTRYTDSKIMMMTLGENSPDRQTAHNKDENLGHNSPDTQTDRDSKIMKNLGRQLTRYIYIYIYRQQNNDETWETTHQIHIYIYRQQNNDETWETTHQIHIYIYSIDRMKTWETNNSPDTHTDADSKIMRM